MLLFYLNQNLELFSTSKNSAELVDFLCPVFQEGSKNLRSFLNLHEHFQVFWEKNLSEMQKTNKIQFLIGPQASFSDTRVIYIWLINWQNIHNLKNQKKEFFIKKLPNELDLTNLSPVLLQDILTNQNNDLEYSKQPRIG
jgi:hypothetical protein